MKRNLLAPLIIVFSTLISSFYSHICGQGIHVIPNPDTPNNSRDSKSGFFQIIAYNNSVVGFYLPTSGGPQLAKYDGSMVSLIPNPDSGYTVYNGIAEYNNSLYFNYANASKIYELGQYDGTSVKLIPFPDGGRVVDVYHSIIFKSAVYNGKLYFNYLNPLGNTQLAQFDGIKITLLPNPDSGSGFTDITTSIVYNNKLYTNYLNADSITQLIQFDGTSFTLIPNPDKGKGGQSAATIFNDKLYFNYDNIIGNGQLAQFDGTTITLIPPPASNTSGSTGSPVVYNNKLCLTYVIIDSLNNKTSQIAQYNGTSIILIPKPDEMFFGFPNTEDPGCAGDFVEYNNKLYIQYYRVSYIEGLKNLGVFDGTIFSLIPNAVNGYGYVPRFVYNNQLMLTYQMRSPNNTGQINIGLGEFDGTSFTLFPNPDAGQGVGLPKVIVNDRLYFLYTANLYITHIVYLDNRTLPINLLNFKGQLQDNDAFLQWQTDTEQNSNHFTIQRSKDGISFYDIGTVKASGSSTAVRSYNYTDPAVIKLGAQKLFYRLQEVDNDGKKQLSNIISINITGSNNHIVMYPNPAKNIVYFDLPQQLSQNAEIILYDINGRKVAQQKPQSNNLHQQLNIKNQLQGNYTVEVIDDGKKIFMGKVMLVH